MSGRLAIYHPAGRLGASHNPFGKDVANRQLFQALVRHGGFESIDVLSQRPGSDAVLADDLLEGQASATGLRAGSILNQTVPVAAGALLRGQPDLQELAWLRRRAAADRAYSLLGLIHTLAPPAVRQYIAMASVAPTGPWDALICTSPSVRDGVAELLGHFGEHLAERTGGAPPPAPSLPIVPLGVDAARLSALADRPDARARLRARLTVGDDDVLVLWVGRLSYYEKAFPQPMFKAVEAAARATGARVSFAMAGWFPDASDQELYEAAARRHAPGVPVHLLDGNDAELLGDLWAGADIFLSLVDNIQETFGITPVEAMAAGLPVVASDWDGYRSTVRDGVDGMLVPTLIGPAGGLGISMSLHHAMEVDSYQAYVGAVAQHTAVHVGRATEALAALIRAPDLRRRMGAAGRARVREVFDWPRIARRYHGLVDELAEIRASASAPAGRHRGNPAKGDPFDDFRRFAGQGLRPDLPIALARGVAPADLGGATTGLDGAFSRWRGTTAECVLAAELMAEGRARTVRQVLEAFPASRRRAVELSLAWMAKMGFVEWLAPDD